VGLTAAELIPLGWVDPFTTMLNCQNYLFLARGLAHVPHDHEEGELIEIVRMPLAEAVGRVLAGEITHGSSAVAILKASAYLSAGGSAINL
jgi:ADP-ribose pyrophosphatase